MSEGPGEHTELTPRSFASFGLMMLGLGLLSVGFSVIDTAMVAPFGLVPVAAVGLGESVVSLLLAFFVGFIDVFTARLARARFVEASPCTPPSPWQWPSWSSSHCRRP